jgi:hypothetical protein
MNLHISRVLKISWLITSYKYFKEDPVPCNWVTVICTSEITPNLIFKCLQYIYPQTAQWSQCSTLMRKKNSFREVSNYRHPLGKVRKHYGADGSHVFEWTHQARLKRRGSRLLGSVKRFRKKSKSKIQTTLKPSGRFIKHSKHHEKGKTGVKLGRILWRQRHLTGTAYINRR